MPMMLLAAVVLVISLLAAASGPALHPDRRDAPPGHLTYTAPGGGRAENRLTLRRHGDDLELLDDGGGAVLRRQPLAATRGVVIHEAGP